MTLAHIWKWLFPALSWLLALGWVWQAAQWKLHFPKLPDLNKMSTANLPQVFGELLSEGAPEVTVVVPACNEAETIEATLRSLLASVEVRLQVLAVNDRSTDDTGARMERLASEFRGRRGAHTLEISHIDTLPAGWLGKAACPGDCGQASRGGVATFHRRRCAVRA